MVGTSKHVKKKKDLEINMYSILWLDQIIFFKILLFVKL